MSENTRFWLVFSTSIVSSIGGLLVAVFVTRNAADGGRGGAIGPAVALAFMFLTRDYGAKLYSAVTRRLPDIEARIKLLEQKGPRGEKPAPPAEATLADLRTRVDALAAAIAIDAKGQKTQNAFLALATFVGTIVWGFGDLGAQILIRHLYR